MINENYKKQYNYFSQHQYESTEVLVLDAKNNPLLNNLEGKDLEEYINIINYYKPQSVLGWNDDLPEVNKERRQFEAAYLSSMYGQAQFHIKYKYNLQQSMEEIAQTNREKKIEINFISIKEHVETKQKDKEEILSVDKQGADQDEDDSSISNNNDKQEAEKDDEEEILILNDGKSNKSVNISCMDKKEADEDDDDDMLILNNNVKANNKTSSISSVDKQHDDDIIILGMVKKAQNVNQVKKIVICDENELSDEYKRPKLSIEQIFKDDDIQYICNDDVEYICNDNNKRKRRIQLKPNTSQPPSKRQNIE